MPRARKTGATDDDCVQWILIHSGALRGLRYAFVARIEASGSMQLRIDPHYAKHGTAFFLSRHRFYEKKLCLGNLPPGAISRHVSESCYVNGTAMPAAEI
jgi:hypothetical protein